MRIVIADKNQNALMEASNFELDLNYGDDKNDFVLSIPDYRLSPNQTFWFDGTPFGGIIDTECPSVTSSGSSITYEGRTFQGMLADKIVSPPSDKTHLVLTGDLQAAINIIVTRVGLSSFFDLPLKTIGVNVNHTVHRYIDAYTALRMLCASVNYRLSILAHDGKPTLSAKPSDTYGDIPSELVCFDATKTTNKYNHIIGLGKGEGTAREVVHFYADKNGTVTNKQTFTGIEERVYCHELSNEEGEELSADVKKKLEDLQTGDEISIDLPNAENLDVGDKVTAVSSEFNIKTTAEITNVIFKVSTGKTSIQYETGIADYPDEETE